MPRFARIVVPGAPCHITHRGNHRGSTFFAEHDREVYLAMLAAACHRFALDVWAYCLMTNHVHLIAVPQAKAFMAAGVGREVRSSARRFEPIQ